LISHLINTGIRYATAPASVLPENNPFNAVVLPTDIDPNNAIIMHKVKVELTGVLVMSFTWLNHFEKGKAPSRAYAKYTRLLETVITKRTPKFESTVQSQRNLARA
jgi:hypothetical protein